MTHEEVKTVEIQGEKSTNLYRDLGRRGWKKKDFYKELFGNDFSEHTASPSYGSVNSIQKSGLLDIAKQLGIIHDYRSTVLADRYNVKINEDSEWSAAHSKHHYRNKIAERCGFEIGSKEFGKADLFDILYEIQNKEESE